MSNTTNTPYKTKSAVLFVIFNRPDTTERVFEQIRAAQPKRLYIAADAPRPNFPEDKALCKQAKDIVKHIDWECDVKTLYKKQNVGLKEGVSSAVTWFFKHEEEGIILEDDCLPANSFFKFCDTLLEKYRDDTRIRHITGCNFQQGKKWGNSSYYFSNRTHVWGWASWKRVWKDYDLNLNKYNKNEVRQQLLNIYNEPLIAENWANIFNQVKAGKINSWAYPLDFINFFNNGLVIIPNENLITNIGFGSNATNITYNKSVFDHIPVTEIDEITHPIFILPEKKADLFIMNYNFQIDEKKRRQNILKGEFKKLMKLMMNKAASF